jgi:hypothetical protein
MIHEKYINSFRLERKRDAFGSQGVDERIILWFLNAWDMVFGLDSSRQEVEA